MREICKGSIPAIRRQQLDILLKMDCKEDMVNILDDNVKLLPFQTIGGMFLYLSGRALLGDSPGLGKTIQVSAFLRLLQFYGQLNKVLIIAPGSNLYQFSSEVTRCTGLNLLPMFGGTEKMLDLWGKGYENFDGIITTPSSFSQTITLTKLLLPYKQDFNVVIYDESMSLMNTDTIIYRTMKQIMSNAQFRICLNGTAITRNLEQFYNQIHLLDNDIEYNLADINSKWGLYGRKNNKDHQLVGYSRTQDLPYYFQYHYLGRDRRILNLTPQHDYKPIYVTPTLNQKLKLTGSNFDEVLFCPDTYNIPLDKENVPAINTLVERVRYHLPTSKIVVYAQHRNIKPVLKKALESEIKGCKVCILDGTIMDNEYKEKIRLDFENGVYNVILLGVTRGINLGSANTMIMYGLSEDWSQLILRIERDVHKVTPKTYEILTYLSTPQIKQIERLSVNENLMNNTLAKEFNIFKSILPSVRSANYYYSNFGQIEDSF